MWPNCVAGRDFEGSDAEDFAVLDDIVSLDKNMSLVVNNEDVEELIDDQENEFSKEELKQLQEQQQRSIAREVASSKDVGREGYA